MRTDPFALIRKRDTGTSTSYVSEVKHVKPVDEQPVFHEKPQISAAKHVKPLKHREIAEAQESASNAPTTIAFADADYEHVPADWRDGLMTLNRMRRPRIAAADRWSQIVLDAHRLACGWFWLSPQPDWSIADVFGFDPENERSHGLVFSIRGGRLGIVERDRAIIVRGGQRYGHHRGSEADVPPIWDLVMGEKRR